MVVTQLVDSTSIQWVFVVILTLQLNEHVRVYQRRI